MSAIIPIVGIYRDIRDAQKSVNDLLGDGFLASEIKLIANDRDENLDNNRTDSTWSRTYPLPGKGLTGFIAQLFARDADEDHGLSSPFKPLKEVHMPLPEGGLEPEFLASCYRQGQHLVVVYTESKRAKARARLERDGGSAFDPAPVPEIFEAPLPLREDRSPHDAQSDPAGERPYL